MRKVVTLLVVSGLMLGGLAACGKKGSPTYKKQASGYTLPVVTE